MSEKTWADEVQLFGTTERKPIYQFKEGNNVLTLDLTNPPRDIVTKFGPKKVIDSRDGEGNEVAVFIPAGSGESSAYGQIVRLVREFGAAEHRVNIIVVGKSRLRRYTVIHNDRECRCGKK